MGTLLEKTRQINKLLQQKNTFNMKSDLPYNQMALILGDILDSNAYIISSDGSLGWSLATALSLLVWFIYAPHCLATLATVKRETGSWKTVSFMTAYLFGLAYLMSFLTYHKLIF